MNKTLGRSIIKNRYVYLLLLPTVLYFVLFQYVPMYGILLAFKEYKIKAGILGSPWAGFDNFAQLIAQADFGRHSTIQSLSAWVGF